MASIILSLPCLFLPLFAVSEDQSDLDRWLHGARIGVAFEAFIEQHPDAVYSDADKRDVPVRLDFQSALLLTHDSDPFLGVSAFANVGFRDKRLYEMVVVWTGIPEIMSVRRERFFAAAVARHGHVYQRETILVHPNTPDEQAVAVLVWREPDAVILAFHTPPSPVAPHPKDVFTYAQFTPGDPFLEDIFEKTRPSEAQQDAAWRGMEEILLMLDTDVQNNDN